MKQKREVPYLMLNLFQRKKPEHEYITLENLRYINVAMSLAFQNLKSI